MACTENPSERSRCRAYRPEKPAPTTTTSKSPVIGDPHSRSDPACPGYRVPMSGDLVITGPVGGGQHGWAFGASAIDVAAAGYVEDEYLIAGEATRYRLTPGATY